MKLIFTKGPFFYAEYNIRLFFLLLFRKVDLLVSNDLDTLLPNYLISKFKGIPIVYDSHELFTETPEVIHRKFVKSFWEGIEKRIFPRLKDVFTVSDSIAGIFKEKYGVDVKVVRNIPPTLNFNNKKSRKEMNLPEDKKIIVLQGSGINIQRGAEELIESMQYVENILLLIIGGGDVINQLKDNFLKVISKINSAFIKRGYQTDIITEHINDSPYPVIICGDLNDTPTSYAYRILSKGLKDAFTGSGKGFGITYAGENFPAFRIDYILHDDMFNAVNFTRNKISLSDHYPISSILIKE